jgi:aspartate kinase
MSNKPIIVQKYGGSSVSDVAGIREVAGRIRSSAEAGYGVVVVVSAMGNTTNELIALAHAVSAQPSRRELDLLVSVGERVSMTLLAMAIQDLGIPARSFTGSQSGIITDNQHISAKIIEVHPYRIERALAAGEVAIVAGFQGMSLSKEVTTLGRGGSDATAVALAAALKAEYCEICSDVDGIYSGDPRLIPQAKKWENLELGVALELSQAGAKVLQAEALALAKERGIRLVASATSKPMGSGTHVIPEPYRAKEASFSVVMDPKLLLYRLTGQQQQPSTELLRQLRKIWSDQGDTFLLMDARNIHGLGLPVDWGEPEPLASLAVVGKISEEQKLKVLELIAQHRLSRWWIGASSCEMLLSKEQAHALAGVLHDLFM